MTELKPCPFCGGEAALVRLRGGIWRAICKSCAANGDSYFAEAEAVAAWNTRAEQDELDAKIEVLLELFREAEHERCDALMRLDAAEAERDEWKARCEGTGA